MSMPPVLRLVSAIYRRLPVMGGHLRLAKPWRGRIERLDGDVTAVLRNGDRIRVDPHDYNGAELLLFGAPDRRVVEICRRFLDDGDSFLDLGANHGAVGLLCRRKIGAGELHFVEPQPELCARIRDCLERNRVERAEVHQIGLWSEAGTLRLARPAAHSGAASLMSDADDSGDSIEVPVARVDAFVEQTTGGRPFGAKVDVEGAETVVVPALLACPGLRFVVFECKNDAALDPIWSAAMEEGFRVAGVIPTIRRPTLRRIESREAFGRQTDYVAYRPDLTPRGVRIEP